MDEHAEIKTSHEALVATIGEAQTLIRGAVAEFLTKIAQAETLCEKADVIAKAWNRESQTLELPARFLVTGHLLLNDIKKAVAKLDIMTPAGALERRPVAAQDLEPRRVLRR